MRRLDSEREVPTTQMLLPPKNLRPNFSWAEFKELLMNLPASSRYGNGETRESNQGRVFVSPSLAAAF